MDGNDSEAVSVPNNVGGYQMRGTVGDGAFSVVKLAMHIESKKYYACKIVPKARISTDNLRERFEIEIHVNQQLRHPGIVALYDLMKDDNNYYLIMEFCPNGELFQYIVDRTHLKEEEAKPLIRQVLETLQYIHSMNISHRDLKPENLLIDQFGRIKFSDFGLSRFIPESGLVDTPCGSPCYASPECISGRPYNGKTTDVWSCGVILYAMLTGQLPWTKRNQTQLFAQIKKGEYVIPNFLSDNCRNFIKGLMTVDIVERLTIEQALEHPWLKNTPPQFETLPKSVLNPAYLSIKKVDNLFESPDEADNDFLVDDSLLNNHSFPQLSILSTLKNIKYGENLPPILISANASASISSVGSSLTNKNVIHEKSTTTAINGATASSGKTKLRPTKRFRPSTKTGNLRTSSQMTRNIQAANAAIVANVSSSSAKSPVGSTGSAAPTTLSKRPSLKTNSTIRKNVVAKPNVVISKKVH
ncbi:CAMK family protein kinase [Tritrichomonas foetus]|uniref:CAMK family protein kinase n=1 Tax=Tritrichomonas foetus TaxID=1144522 RepID=A0A1J4KJM5_9EUKA|nr:CAMK family protein kinase [Tritrichomonas foetus]|eukprot:OHT09565.1 CAMK family protein kinase [Tritrichomonas foetus]